MDNRRRRADHRLWGWEIHGFHTLEDLDFGSMVEEARFRWLRPNEIHAILCNYTCFSVNVKPVNLPTSGTVVLFDRRMLRNFRKDGHNWKKKKDGKSVKEAHEHLKVGDEERLHVYYAHGEDNMTFVRRCYWLLDKKLENIVFVHYRETQESPSSTVMPVNLNSSSIHSNPSAPWLLSEKSDYVADCAYYAAEKDHSEHGKSATLRSHEMRLHEINTLEWEELVAINDPVESITTGGENMTCFRQDAQYVAEDSEVCGSPSTGRNMQADLTCLGTKPVATNNPAHFDFLDTAALRNMECQASLDEGKRDSIILTPGESLGILVKDALQTEDSFGRWMNCTMTISPRSVTNPLHLSPKFVHDSTVSPLMDNYQSNVSEKIFNINEISPPWAFSTEETKILVIGCFQGDNQGHTKRNLLCVCGNVRVPVEAVQVGVFRCFIPPHAPGQVNFFFSFDGRKPISQMLTFEYRASFSNEHKISAEDKSNLEECQVQARLAHLLFSTSNRPTIPSSKASQLVLKEAHEFMFKTSHINDSWTSFLKLNEDDKVSVSRIKESLFELALKNRLQVWLFERIISGHNIIHRDDQGRGVIHLCAILGYTWAANLFAWSGISLDYRDTYGWTAIHWAAYCGREKMVAALLSAGAKPNLVTDPTPENPGGYTAADLASMKGHDGLGAFLAENSLVEQFRDMIIAGNVSGPLQISTLEPVDPNNLTEDELYLKDTLAAYRTAADAAARIQTAFRDHSLKVWKKAVQESNSEVEARKIVAAMKIQNAFRNRATRKKISAAAQIQHRFHTWKIRRNFVNMRHQAIKIQAAFRRFQMRRQYHKIVWSVGVLEKAILRWRLKRRGFRGLQVCPVGVDLLEREESDMEEDFFQASRKQAEERIEKSVIWVQAMFRSKKAQQQYQRMKLIHNQAKVGNIRVVPQQDIC